MLPFKHGLSEDGDTVTLRKLKPIADAITYTHTGESDGLKILVLDTECTGLADDDEMVEIGVAAFTVSEAGEFIKYHKTANWLQEPSRPMHPEAEQVTGLTLEGLKGERFDDEAIEKALHWCDIIIAHNAQYDYGKMKQRYSAAMRGKIWLCTFRQMRWLDHGHDSAKLSSLAYEHGFFFEKHRTDGDIHAVAYLLSLQRPDGRTYLSELLEQRLKKHQALAVTRSPFDVKDAWRERRYRWHPMRKCWWCLYAEDKIKLEEEFIKTDPRLKKVTVKYTLVDIPEDRVFDPEVLGDLL